MREPKENTKELPFFGTVVHITHEQAKNLSEMFMTAGWSWMEDILEYSQEVDVAGVFVDPTPVMMEGANQAKGSWRLAEALRSQIIVDVKAVLDEFEKEFKEEAKRTTGK